MARWQYQRFVTPLANDSLVPAEPWMGQQPDQVPRKATLPVAVIATTVLAFVPIVVVAETMRSAPSDSGVITQSQTQYQSIAFPLFQFVSSPDQPYHQPEYPVQPRLLGWALPTTFFTPSHEDSEGSTLGWRGYAPDWLPPKDIRAAMPSLSFVHSPDSIQAGWRPVYPDRLYRKTAPVTGDYAFTPAHEATEGNSLSWWPRYPDWMPPITRPHGGLSFSPFPIPGFQPQPFPQTEIPVQPRRVGWALPTEFFVNSPDSIQIGWVGNYPAWIASKAMPLRPSLFFTPAHEATEGNSLSWWPRYPDRHPPLWRPDGLFALNPSPITAPEAPQQTYHQPEIPVQPRRVAWAVPFSVWVPQHSATEGSALDWWPRYPDRLNPRSQPPAMFASSFSTASIPQIYSQTEWPVRRSPARWMVPWGTFVPAIAPPNLPWFQTSEPVRRAENRSAFQFLAFAPQVTAAVPDIPWLFGPDPVRRIPQTRTGLFAWGNFTPPVPTQFWRNPPDPTRRIARPTWTEFAWHPVTPAAATPAIPLSQEVIPVWSRQWHPSLQTESRGPVAPVPTRTIQRVVGIVGSLLEQSGGSYVALLRDPQGNIVPGGLLQTLRLTLYTVNRDNTLSYVNSRDHQPCLNLNDVTVYNAVQTTASGRRFNVRFKIQPADTTLIDPSLAFERHIMLWEYTWADGAGKHEATFVVHNVRVVT